MPQTFQNGPTSRCASYLPASHIRIVYMYNIPSISYKNFKTGLQVDVQATLPLPISVPFTCKICHRHFKTGLQVDVQATLSFRISVPFTCTISHRHFKTGLQSDVQATLSLRISIPFTCTTPPPPPSRFSSSAVASSSVNIVRFVVVVFVHRLSPVLGRHTVGYVSKL